MTSTSDSGGPRTPGDGHWSVGSVLRFLFTDRLGILGLVWALGALVARPVLLAAHNNETGALAATIREALDAASLARLTALAQWGSLSVLLALVAIAHTRLAFAAPTIEPGGRRPPAFLAPALYATLLCSAYMLFYWTPTSTFVLMTHDSFIFFDASYRILHGQTPSADFPTALGAASLYLPAMGVWLAGGFAGSLELASAIVALVLGLACAVAGRRRLPGTLTSVLVVIVFLTTVPAVLLERWGGDSATVVNKEAYNLADHVTWAMFYNRWGWATLIPIFVMLAPRKGDPASTRERWLELGVLATLLTFLFYLKLSYFIVGMGAAGAYALLNDRPVRTLLQGGAATLGLIVVVGLLGGFLLAYVRDVLFVAGISGGRGETLFAILRKNTGDILLSTAPMIIVIGAGKATWRDYLASSVMMVGSIYAMMQNAQLINIVSLVGLGAYGVARALDLSDRMARYAAVSSFVILVATPVFDRSVALLEQVATARREETRDPAPWSAIPALKGIRIPERESFFRLLSDADTVEKRNRALLLIGAMSRKQELRQGEYMQIVMAGLDDLKPVLKPDETVVALDMASPLSFLTGTRPAEGAWLTLHAGRSVSEDHYPDPATMFADVDHVMIAKASLVQPTAELMDELYDEWLTANYRNRVETEFWVRYSGRKAPG